MTTTFPRYYKPGIIIRATSFGAELLTVTSLGLSPRSDPHVSFEVVKSLTPSPDTAEVEIANLSPVRRKLLSSVMSELGEFELEILQGWDGRTMRLFRGVVRSFRERARRDSDIFTVMTADDAGDVLDELPLRGLSSLGLTATQMVDAAIAAYATFGGTVIAKHPSTDAVLASSDPKISFTAVSIGRVSELLDEAARICKARWWVQDGLLYMSQQQIPVNPVAFVLPGSHLLVEPSQDGSGLTRTATFCDPSLLPGGQVQLLPEGSSSPYQLTPDVAGYAGFYRVEHAIYTGDTEATSPWMVNLTLRSLR